MIPSSTPKGLRRMNAEPSPSSSSIGSSASSFARVVGVVLVDRGAEVDLAERLLDRLAHLAHDDLGEPLALLGVQLADAADERRALLDRRWRRSSRGAPSSARPIASRSSSSLIVGYFLTVSPVAGLTTA